ncbi:Anaphase-promoting complex subunit 2 [Coemansia sp. RSA 988]|nr:Anaphase-promoting complex subunit 2 [Coemansia sp. RSA 988]
MSVYNLCDGLSNETLDVIVQQLKARSVQDAVTNTVAVPVSRVDDNIDRLAIEYHTKLSQSTFKEVAATDGASSLLRFTQFLTHLDTIDNIRREYEREASIYGDEVSYGIAIAAWKALMYELVDQTIGQLVEDWLYTALCCLLRIVQNNDLQLLLGTDLGPCAADLHNYLQGDSIHGSDETTQMMDILHAEEDIANWQHQLYEYALGSDHTLQQLVDNIVRGCRLLVELHILDYTRGQTLNTVDRVIQDYVRTQELQWEQCCLEPIRKTLCLAASVLDILLQRFGSGSALVDIQPLDKYTETQLFRQFSELRMGELFSMIVDFPDSRPAIDDLRQCAGEMHNMREIAVSLRSAVQQRLLHPGATTSDILTQYISTIRCLRLLDPSSTVLEIVARPIRDYLRLRDDTVACIVQDMVSEESELFEDLASGQRVIMDDGPEGIIYDEDSANRNWEPLPIEAKSVYRTAQRRDADVLSLLVSIYDTKDVFVQEFEASLAKRLLACTDYNTTRELRQVEMMKLRFGGTAMERCEVMLKDIADSKRINQNVLDASHAQHVEIPFHGTVISRQFWGPVQLETFALPPKMAAIRDRYVGVYESLKPARKLEWRDSLGQVTINIELEDRSVELSVRPSQAAVLYAFQDLPRLTLEELMLTLECSEDFVLPRVRFWLARGVLREISEGIFEIAESLDPSNAANDSAAGNASVRHAQHNGTAAQSDDDYGGEEEDDPESTVTTADARSEALRVHFNYIVGMLTNFGPLPLDRILGMLGMFLPGENTTAEDLRNFLAMMVREDRLDLVGGMYKLK